MIINSLKKSGGKRKGAGRPPAHPLLKKRTISPRISEWLIQWIGEQPENKTELIESALIEKHKLTPPDAGN